MLKFAVISDIHYGLYARSIEFSVPGEAISDNNRGAVSIQESFIEQLIKHEVNYLLVAGDLTSVGSPQEFHYCEDQILKIAEKANIPLENVIIGLGNHDIDWKITELHEQYKNDNYSEELQQLVKEKYENISANVSIHNMSRIKQPEIRGPIPFCGVNVSTDAIFFVLNSGFQCVHDQKIKHGRIAAEQLEWFENVASEYSSDERLKVLLLHHHPHNYKYHLPSIDISTLEEGPEITEIAGKSGIDLIVHGHRHHPKAVTKHESGWLKPICFLCAGSFSVNTVHRSQGEIPNTFHIVEYNGNGNLLTLYNYEYKSSTGWIPLETNCHETPLDYKMMLGKIVTEKEVKENVLELPSINNGFIKWDNVDDTLKCIPLNTLNSAVKKYLSSDYDIGGFFPANTIIVKKED